MSVDSSPAAAIADSSLNTSPSNNDTTTEIGRMSEESNSTPAPEEKKEDATMGDVTGMYLLYFAVCTMLFTFVDVDKIRPRTSTCRFHFLGNFPVLFGRRLSRQFCVACVLGGPSPCFSTP